MAKVSIIVPVYNAEDHLKVCIDSILNQSYNNIEIILIDNGSTDSSILICEEYANKHDIIKFDYQERKGPSAARNKGIDLATGKYLQFVDSDDSIGKNMTEKLVESMKEQVSLVICGNKTIVIDGERTDILKISPPFTGRFSIKQFNERFAELFYENLINPPWNKLYLKKLIEEYHIRFEEDINIGEDLLFNLDYFKQCTEITVINDSLYNYINYKNSNSLTGSFKNNFFENQKMLFGRIREYLHASGSYENSKDIIENIYTNSIIGCFENLFHKQSRLDSNLIKKEINKVITDETLIKILDYFLKGDIQRRLIGYFIKGKNTNLIYFTVKFKIFIRNRLTPIFKVLKTINSLLK